MGREVWGWKGIELIGICAAGTGDTAAGFAESFGEMGEVAGNPFGEFTATPGGAGFSDYFGECFWRDDFFGHVSCGDAGGPAVRIEDEED